MSTDATRGRKPYPTDLTDAEWAILEPLVPPAGTGGRPRTVDVREVMNGIFYRVRTGCQWRALPHDLPPWPTVHDYHRRFRLAGAWQAMNDALVPAVRMAAGCDPEPSVAIIDSQSVKGTEKRGPAPGTTAGSR